jgi:hypothetical protein
MDEEAYSPAMAEWVALQLAQVPPKVLAQLRTYYDQRGGPGLAPGLALVKAEQLARINSPLLISEPDGM